MLSLPSTPLIHLQKIVRKKGADALLIRNPKNRYYLTGFDASEGILMVTKKECFFFLDGRYLELGKKHLKGMSIRSFTHDFTELAAIIKKDKIAQIAYEKGQFHEKFIEKLTELLKEQPNTKTSHTKKRTFVPVEKVVEEARIVKTTEELSKIKKACALTDQVFDAMKKQIRLGMREKDLQLLLRKIAVEYQVLDLAFPPIIGINAGSSYPHYMLHSSRRLEKGDTILFDMGMSFEGYQSDMTRMLFVGKPAEDVQKMYEKVLKLQEHAIKRIVPQTSIGKSLALFEKELQQEKLEKLMMHSLGHGVGLDVHELPLLSSKNTAKWQTGMIVAVEPGVYFPGKYGIRIEDTCYVDRKKATPLTKSGKQLLDCIIKL